MKESHKHQQKKQRQACINFLHRVSRKVFKMFRDTSIDSQQFVTMLDRQMKKLAPYTDTTLDADYHKQLRTFLQQLHRQCQSKFDLEAIRNSSMKRMNHIQKLKNSKNYKKEKHRKKLTRGE